MPHIQRPPRRSTDTTIELRGPSGRLYGRFDPKTMRIEFRKGETHETIDLTPLLKVKESA